jgi:hypothetical protein
MLKLAILPCDGDDDGGDDDDDDADDDGDLDCENDDNDDNDDDDDDDDDNNNDNHQHLDSREDDHDGKSLLLVHKLRRWCTMQYRLACPAASEMQTQHLLHQGLKKF